MFDFALTNTNFERIDCVKLIMKDDGDDAENKSVGALSFVVLCC